MVKKRLLLIVPLALGLALTACNRTEDAPVSAGPADGPGRKAPDAAGFSREMRALKARNLGQDMTEAGIRELLARHGYPLPEIAATAESEPAVPEEPQAAGSGALGKAAVRQTVWKTMKNFNFGNSKVILTSCNVLNGHLFHAYTRRLPAQSGVDPFAVAWYQTSGFGGERSYQMKVVDVSDDSVDLDPALLWTNNTGITKKVYVMAFAFSAATSGNATLVVRPSLTPPTTFEYPGYMGGKVVYNNNSVNTIGCSGPTQSRITLTRTAGNAGTRGIIAVDEINRLGGFAQSDNVTLTLNTIIPSGHPSFLLGFSTAGALDPFPVTTYNTVQGDKYSCDVVPFP